MEVQDWIGSEKGDLRRRRCLDECTVRGIEVTRSHDDKDAFSSRPFHFVPLVAGLLKVGGPMLVLKQA